MQTKFKMLQGISYYLYDLPISACKNQKIFSFTSWKQKSVKWSVVERFKWFFEKKNRDWSYVRMFLLSVKILMKNVHTLHPHKLIQLITFALGDDWSWKGKEATRDSTRISSLFSFYISVKCNWTKVILCWLSTLYISETTSTKSE